MQELTARLSDMGMTFSLTGLIAALLFSLLGFAYFRVGRKAEDPAKWISGVALMVYPMFVTNTVAIVGLLLAGMPWILRRLG